MQARLHVKCAYGGKEAAGRVQAQSPNAVSMYADSRRLSRRPRSPHRYSHRITIDNLTTMLRRSYLKASLITLATLRGF